MKKLVYILSLLLFTGLVAKAQDDGADEKIRDKMREYIQKRLALSKNESEKFTPVFVRYFKEWRTTLRENRGPKLDLQQKIVDLRLRYRTEFKEILGEKRSNEVYEHQEKFIREIRIIGKERLQNRQTERPKRTEKLQPL